MKEKHNFCRFSTYLKERFGCRVYKIGIDANFSCPNKDGSLSEDVCIYCDNRAFSFNTRFGPKSIQSQINEGMDFGKRRYGAEKFIVYFQAHTNTYAPKEVLKERYEVIRKFDNVVGLSIGNRPDCVNDDILDLIDGYSRDYEVWIEYGLQSVHDRTLEFINRGHKYEDFLKAVRMTKKRNIKTCAHVIIGLPGETKKNIIKTSREISRLKIDAVKIHPLYIVKGTRLEELYDKGLYSPLEFDEFEELTREFLMYLGEKTIIQRIGADCPPSILRAPLWILEKN
jgi:hypothetical protein